METLFNASTDDKFNLPSFGKSFIYRIFRPSRSRAKSLKHIYCYSETQIYLLDHDLTIQTPVTKKQENYGTGQSRPLEDKGSTFDFK